MNAKHFEKVPIPSIRRSMQDLSYSKLLTCDMGELIPVMCDEVVPGDYIKIGNEAVIRMQPLVAPVLHEINYFVHYFFVPYRILWTDWENFITGGPDGSLAPTMPTWTPTSYAEGSLWDYLGFPTGVLPAGIYPIDFPRRAYNRIYNEYYRDQNLITAVAETNENILIRSWEKNYFTTALPWQQRGTSPAIPIDGFGNASWPAAAFLTNADTANNRLQFNPASIPANTVGTPSYATQVRTWFNQNVVSYAGTGGVDVGDLRLTIQIQRWMERNAIAGVRYKEFLLSHFGVSPRDERLQRPEYIGGCKAPVIISEVMQTSESGTTAQGNLAGHGLSVNRAYCGKIHVKEHGLIMGIMSVMPKAVYAQGINRQWLRKTKFDFFFPEFVGLSEQEVYRGEIYADGVSGNNLTVFGFQGRFNEMRSKHDMYCGQMRSSMDHWHIGIQYAAYPILNSAFINCVPRKDIFAVPSVDGLIVNVGNKIRAFRPIPQIPIPGGL